MEPDRGRGLGHPEVAVPRQARHHRVEPFIARRTAMSSTDVDDVGRQGQVGAGPQVGAHHLEAGVGEQVGHQLPDLAQPQHPDAIDGQRGLLAVTTPAPIKAPSWGCDRPIGPAPVAGGRQPSPRAGCLGRVDAT